MKWFVGLVFAPALALIALDPAMAKTIRPDGVGLLAMKDETEGRQSERSGVRSGGVWGDLLPGFQPVPSVPPLPGKQAKLRHGFAFLEGGSDGTRQKGKIVGDLLRAGAQHRKAVWPDLDFGGHGHRRSTPVRSGGGGGWDEGPGDPITPPGDDPEDHTDGPTDGGNPYIPEEHADDGDKGDAISPVPLPAAGWLMMAAVSGMVVAGRRRKHT